MGLIIQKMVSYGIPDLDCPDLMKDFEESGSARMEAHVNKTVNM
jgi:hypothetical protein